MPKRKSLFVDSHIPLYYQLENLLREKINSGAFQPDEKLPTENQIMEDYDVSRITVRQALKALAKDGLIERKQGNGTFIVERKVRKRRFAVKPHLVGSLDGLITMGLDAKVRVLEMNLINAERREAEMLGIKTGAAVYMLKRLRIYKGEPFGLIVNYMPESVGRKLSQKQMNSGALLQSMEVDLGYTLESARQEVYAKLADPFVAEVLKTRVGAPLLTIERTVYTDEKKPIEYVHSVYQSEVYGFSMRFERERN
ncbi:MAG: GntR family transcriptional regulator [Pyrinomonadaceae bacterium]